MGDNLETLKEVNISIICINLAKRMTEWQIWAGWDILSSEHNDFPFLGRYNPESNLADGLMLFPQPKAAQKCTLFLQSKRFFKNPFYF